MKISIGFVVLSTIVAVAIYTSPVKSDRILFDSPSMFMAHPRDGSDLMYEPRLEKRSTIPIRSEILRKKREAEGGREIRAAKEKQAAKKEDEEKEEPEDAADKITGSLVNMMKTGLDCIANDESEVAATKKQIYEIVEAKMFHKKTCEYPPTLMNDLLYYKDPLDTFLVEPTIHDSSNDDDED